MSVELRTVPPTNLESGTTRPQQEPLSKTDWKIYGLVVLSYLLIGIGIALAAASVYMATIVHPMVAMATPALPIVLGVLGLTSNNPTEMLFPKEPVQSREKGQPIGLVNKNGVNCWVNSVVQLLRHVSAYQKALKTIEEEFESNYRPSDDACEAYMKLFSYIQTNNQYDQINPNITTSQVSSVDTQKLREAIYDQTCFVEEIPGKKLSEKEREQQKWQPITSRAAVNQEDPWEALSFFLEASKHALPIVKETNLRNEPGHPDHNIPSIKRCGAGPKPFYCFEFEVDKFRKHSSLSFDYLLNNEFFNTTAPTPTGKGINVIKRCLESVPDDFTVYLKRTTYKYIKPGLAGHTKPIKSKKPVDFSLQFEGDEKYFGGRALFRCDGCIVHDGAEANGGHFYACVLKDNIWYRISDTRVTKLSEAKVKQELSKASIVHYAKKEEAA